MTEKKINLGADLRCAVRDLIRSVMVVTSAWRDVEIMLGFSKFTQPHDHLLTCTHIMLKALSSHWVAMH